MANRVERERASDREALANLQNIWNHNYDPSAGSVLPATFVRDGLPSSRSSSSNRWEEVTISLEYSLVRSSDRLSECEKRWVVALYFHHALWMEMRRYFFHSFHWMFKIYKEKERGLLFSMELLFIKSITKINISKTCLHIFSLEYCCKSQEDIKGPFSIWA